MTTPHLEPDVEREADEPIEGGPVKDDPDVEPGSGEPDDPGPW